MNDKALTRAAILAQCEWKEDGFTAVLVLRLPVLGTVPVHIATTKPPAISDRSIAIVSDTFNLDENALHLIKQHLWESCMACCEYFSCIGEVKPGQTETEANHERYGVFNPDDAFARSHLMDIYISEDDEELKGNYGHLNFDNEWNTHVDVVVMKNGKNVGRGDTRTLSWRV